MTTSELQHSPQLDTSGVPSILEKVAYGCGDLSSNLLWGISGSFLMYYYTDVLGLAPASIAILLLAVRVFDALIDPVIGYAIDRSKGRLVLPLMRWLAIPFGIVALLAFLPISGSANIKLIWCYVTYLAFGAVYSGINTPYGILGNLITTNAQARVSLSSYRMTGSMIGILLISMLTLPMVHWLGGGESRASEAAGFPRFMAIVAVFGSALWLVVIKFCRIRATPAENHHNMRELCGALARNRPWLVANLLFALNFFNICGLVSFTIYFAKVVIGRSVEFGGFLLTICTIASLLGTMTVPYLCHWFGRRRTLLLSFVVQIAAWLVVFATAGRSEAYLPALLLASFALGFSAPILYALLSDVIDYGTSTTGVRTAGLAYAINSLVQKVSFAAAGSFLAWLLDLGGYLPASATQPTSAAAAIMVGFVWVPVASCVLSILATFALPGDDQIRKHVAAVA